MVNDGSASWLAFIALLPVIFYVASMREKISSMEKKLDLTLETLDGLRRYLYEIDPQFDDERASESEMNDAMSSPMAAYDDLKLIESKEAAGKRTLTTRFTDR